jgi:AcrR family transcriptional regulator
MSKYVDKEEKRQQVMKTAIELFLKKGYKSVTTREIAAEAGISKGTLYHYFKNKDDLFERTIREHIFRTIAHKTALEENNINPQEHLEKLIDICCGTGEHIDKRFKMMFDFITYCSDKQVMQEVINSIYEEMRSIIEHIISDAFPELAQDPGKLHTVINMIIAFLDGIHFQHFINPTTARMSESNELFWNIITEKLRSAQFTLAK